MTLFAQSSYLDRDVEDWHFETWAWLMGAFGGVRQLKWGPLITPDPQFFPPTSATGHERAQHIFSCIRGRMGAADFDCVLLDSEARQADALSDGKVVIIYTLDGDPMTTVSEMAHGMAAEMVNRQPQRPPGGDDLFWPACSLAVAYKGFGIFGANAALEADSFGRSVTRKETGYLSELTWSLALATYLALTDRQGQAAGWLDSMMEPLVHDAERYLRRHPDRLAPLLAID